MSHQKSDADRIRAFVRENYIRRAREQKLRRFQVRAGDVHKAMGLRARVPAVCSALASRELREENGLRLVEKVGPPSGQSTTVSFTFEWRDTGNAAPSAESHPLLRLTGIGEEVFRALGGGEEFLRGERAGWSGTEIR